MGDDKENKKLDMIVWLCKENHKLCKAMVDYFSNSRLDVNNHFNGIEKKLDKLETEIHDLDKLRAEEPHVYTDEELAKLKKTMSWNQLHRQAKIPVSTLQYRYRRCKNETEEHGG